MTPKKDDMIEDDIIKSLMFLGKDLDNFKFHIKKFHTSNGIPDNSLHEEDGFYFRVDKNFYNKLFEE